MTYEEARKKMSAIGQEHIFKYYDELDEEQKAALIKQVEETDFSVLGNCLFSIAVNVSKKGATIS